MAFVRSWTQRRTRRLTPKSQQPKRARLSSTMPERAPPKCHNLGPHQIGKVKHARSLDMEAAQGTLVLRPEHGPRLTGGEVHPSAPEIGGVDGTPD